MRFLSLPVSEWRVALESLNRDECNRNSIELAEIAERAARLHGYIEGRYLCHDAPLSHEAGVIASNRMATEARRALGYAVAKREVIF